MGRLALGAWQAVGAGLYWRAYQRERRGVRPRFGPILWPWIAGHRRPLATDLFDLLEEWESVPPKARILLAKLTRAVVGVAIAGDRVKRTDCRALGIVRR